MDFKRLLNLDDDLYPAISDRAYRGELYFEGEICIDGMATNTEGMSANIRIGDKVLLKSTNKKSYQIVAVKRESIWHTPLPIYVDQDDRYIVSSYWVKNLTPRLIPDRYKG